jgi:hypothetical protein
MNSDFIPYKDYKYMEFVKNEKDTIKRIKTYSIRNCRKEIQTEYITKTLLNFDYGFSYFRTEQLKINNEKKVRPCAFACLSKIDNTKVILLLICAIKTMDKLGTKLLNDVIKFCIKNNFESIILECVENNREFYEKNGFIFKKIVNDELLLMEKKIK